MIVAIPLENGKLCNHFGHCGAFALMEVDAGKAVVSRRDVDAPPHEPGLLPRWLNERGVRLVICGGMGPQALTLCAEKGIQIVTGAPIDTPENSVLAWGSGTLRTAENSCDH